jgi:hypothetical protein
MRTSFVALSIVGAGAALGACVGSVDRVYDDQIDASPDGGADDSSAGDAPDVAVDGFTVGGSLTGLADGGSIVLQNNGAADLTRNANGLFTFGVGYASGAPYEVTVKTQPAYPPQSETCAVTNGSGTIAQASVASVVVACAVNQFKVGGNVSGLTGTGLQLRNNGADTLGISGNVAFQFATALASGSPYAVTVFTQPSGQKCAVGSGSGTVGNATVSNVAVTCFPSVLLSESFDALAVNAIPANWNSAVLVGNAGDKPWGAESQFNSSAPMGAGVNEAAHATDIYLETPNFAVGTSTATLTFHNDWDLEAGQDGGVLEISLNGATYQDIVAAGGSFAANGYTGTLAAGSGNPLAGRQAWTGLNGGAFVQTRVNLPAAAAGKNVSFRWRIGTDTQTGSGGWRIDDVVVAN